MSAFHRLSGLNSSNPGIYNSTAASNTSDDIAYQSYIAPGEVDLNHGLQDKYNDVLREPFPVAAYPVPSTDTSTGASFDNQYSTFALGDGLHALFHTESLDPGYGPSDSTRLALQLFDDAGNLISGTTTLSLNGQSAVKDLTGVNESSLADFNNSFAVAYATNDPQSGTGQINVQQFDEAGNPLAGGVAKTFDDGTQHGLNFSTFAPAGSAHPSYLLQNRANGSEALQNTLYSADLQQTLASSIIRDTGPHGEASTSLDRYSFLRPEGTRLAVLSQTFQYTDRRGNEHEEVQLERIDPRTLQVQAKTRFEVNSGNSTGVTMQHLADGNFLAAYSDGGQTVFKKFNGSLDQIGGDYNLPHDNGGFDSIVKSGQHNFEVYWREYADPDTSNVSVRHSQVFTG